MFRKFFLLVLLQNFLFGLDFYYVSYRFVSQNAKYKNQTLHISKAMQTPKTIEKLDEFLIENSAKITSVQQFLNQHQDELMGRILRLGVFVNARSKTQKNVANTKNILLARPMLIGVDIKSNFVTISLYKTLD